ncbi:acyl-CoA N-acyltransferase [Thozetella sp. PMI_491]|nr:acyl-CoA N-acyltransferase [Thozetella sp. PMI_491]
MASPDSPILQTSRLTLRPLTTHDASALFALNQHKEVAKWSETLSSAEDAADRISTITSTPNAHTFAISLDNITASCAAGDFIGTVGTQSAAGPVSYQVDPALWGNGYGTEALEAFSRWIFQKYPQKDRLVAMTDKENIASMRVLEKVGFDLINPSIRGKKHPEKEWRHLRQIKGILEASQNIPRQQTNQVVCHYDAIRMPPSLETRYI